MVMKMINEDMIFFIISNQDDLCIRDNQIAYSNLFQKGFHPYAPIFRTYWVNDISHYETQKPDCLTEDLYFLNRFLGDDYSESVICPRCGNYFSGIQDLDKWQEPISHGWCHQKVERAEFKLLPRKINYDSGVIGIVLSSALDSIKFARHKIESGLPINYQSDVIKRMNLSIDAIKLYECMKLKHVLIIPIEIALNQPPEDFRNFGL